MKVVNFLRNFGLIVLAFLGLATGLGAASTPVQEADKFLAGPALDLPRALLALDLYADVLAHSEPPQAPLLTRLARTCYLLGELTVPSQRYKYYEKGQTYAKMLLKEEPTRVEGPYWLAMHLCGQADSGGALMGRKLLPQIMQELERSRTLDETYDQAGCHRVLGRIYFEAPAWPFSVGDLLKSLEHLNRAVVLAPENSTNHLYLAETLLRLHRQEQARLELERVLKCSQHSLMPKGLEDDRKEAKKLLEGVKALSKNNH